MRKEDLDRRGNGAKSLCPALACIPRRHFTTHAEEDAVIFTDKFVYVDMPKTGGTFVRHVLGTIYRDEPPHTRIPAPRSPAFSAPSPERGPSGSSQTAIATKTGSVRQRPANLEEQPQPGPVETRFNGRYGEAVFWEGGKHGVCWQIPSWERRKPLARFDEVASRFPNISFAEYVDLANHAFSQHPPLPVGGAEAAPPPRDDLGMYTLDFLNFYFRKPEEVYPILSDEYVSSGRYKENLFPLLRFIRTHRLNEELHQFVVEMGYRHEDVEFILGLGKIRPEEEHKMSPVQGTYFTAELKRIVREKERLIFALFPEFDG
jgi:hypothetical protein